MLISKCIQWQYLFQINKEQNFEDFLEFLTVNYPNHNISPFFIFQGRNNGESNFNDIEMSYEVNIFLSYYSYYLKSFNSCPDNKYHCNEFIKNNFTKLKKV